MTDLSTYLSGYVYKAGFLPKPIPLIFSGGTVFTVNSSNNVEVPPAADNQVVFPKGIALVHLGNDPHAGQAATQFQVPTQGSTWTDTLNLTPGQKATFSTVTISLTARGVECSSATIRLVQSGTQTGPPPQILGATALNKTFDTLIHAFSLQSLQPGPITLSIETATMTPQTTPTIAGGVCVPGDQDDFEFGTVVGTLS